jgi:5'-methylthioadenosine phosphorylase
VGKAKIGIIGGSGLYDIEGITDLRSVRVKTPFGDPSDEYRWGTLEGRDVVFLPRHGRGHRLLPTELNYRANIYGFKKMGVEWIIAISAVGSFKQEIRPLDIVIIDQFFDRTNQARESTFFGDGIVAHISFAEPLCPVLREILCQVATQVGARVHMGGTYLNMEGPAFSTKAESLIYKSWGIDVIGMTNMTEAKLAREAEICYGTLAMVTDYDCWYKGEDVPIVTIDQVIKNLLKNTDVAKEILKKAVPLISEQRNCLCTTALKDAIITPKDMIPPETKKRVELITEKYL